ncbi:MAG TPA: tRNA (N6-isopentenyl adenosine(37)-C2)-methylthiotransferase MiaB [Candidatus Acidoferrales bacterium]|nr:tRNA (N6-isopentenyl adenosine(37)-C2)-methylthiotransferase MiaB [Candidatus Acidoferrales bacterium]
MKLFIQTYGCQINEYDSERIVETAAALGYERTDKVEDADLIVLNTCSVRDKAEQKVYSALGRLRELKERKRALIIGVGGCVAQQEKERLLERAPHVDFVFGTHNIRKLPELLAAVQRSGARHAATDFYRDPSYMESLAGRTLVEGPKAYVAIMQGCNKVCSFCVVPHVRGRELSRPSAAIVSEVEALVRRGVKEVMLLGQNVNSYGLTSPGEITFPELLERINRVAGLARIRFTTSHPQDLSPGLIEAFATLDKLCEHLHLPVQSGSDTVLQRMRRGYRLAEYRARVERLRDRCPGIALTSDIIVGFPGETEREFDQTLEMLYQVEYDDVYAFAYSARPQTVAAKLYADDVPEQVKRERLQQVLAVQNEISLRKNRAAIGSVEELLIEGAAKLKKDQVMGRTRKNKVVNLVGAQPPVGSIARVRIVGATANSLAGEWLDSDRDSLYA